MKLRTLAFTLALALAPLLAAPAIATETMDKIKQRCSAKWSTDYEMQKYCIDNQIEAANKFVDLRERHAEDSEEYKILGRCFGKWTKQDNPDWEMVVYCTENQIKAYEAVR